MVTGQRMPARTWPITIAALCEASSGPAPRHDEVEALRYPCMKALLILALILLLSSCASNYSMRKCDGRRGERVPMGVL